MHGVATFRSAFAASLTRFAAGIVLCALPLTGEALAGPRSAAMAMDANTGEVLHAQSADEPRHPASLTKMMTLYMAFGEIEAGRLTYDSRIKVSEAAAAVTPSKLELEPGSDIALIDAMKALVTKSANDMAVAIAERIAGSEDAFAKLMTARARQIGMRATTFRNASGLPDDEQLTTARDMLTLALRLQDDYPKHYRLFALKSFTYAGETHRNHNSLLFNYSGTDGIKTGYTRDSGFNLVASVHRDGRHVIAAVFGGETAGTRNAHMRSILSRALQKASTVKSRRPASLLIAEAKPAPRPILALKSEPRPAPRPPRPIATAPASKPWPAAVEANTAVSPAPPSPTPSGAYGTSVTAPATMDTLAAAAAEPEPAIPPPFEIAMVKVRPATVNPPHVTAQPLAGATPLASPEPSPAPALASLVPKFDFNAVQAMIGGQREAAPASSAPAAETETVIAKSMSSGGLGRTPGTLDQQLAGIADAPPPSTAAFAAGMAVVPPAARVTTAVPSPPTQPPKWVRGAAPSTLAAQAARLAREQTPAAATLAAPQHLGGPGAAGNDYDIQIGAFATAAEAESRMAGVQGRTAILAGHPALALPAQDGSRLVYRARFAGFDSAHATAACLELRRSAVDCFVAKAE